jgi:hypothetical protein
VSYAGVAMEQSARIAELEAALKGALTLCRDCDGKGGWDAVDDLPYVACLLCAPYRSVL